MGQLIGLAILFCTVAAVCGKLFRRQPETLISPEQMQQLQAAYRQGFSDGLGYLKNTVSTKD